MPKVIFNVVPENIEEPHVAQHVYPPRVQKHRGKEGNHHRRQSVSRRARQKGRQMARHLAKLAREEFITSRIQRRLEQVNENIERDQKPVYVRRAVSWLVVSRSET